MTPDCPRCRGTGEAISHWGLSTCRNCGGTGRLSDPRESTHALIAAAEIARLPGCGASVKDIEPIVERAIAAAVGKVDGVMTANANDWRAAANCEHRDKLAILESHVPLAEVKKAFDVQPGCQCGWCVKAREFLGKYGNKSL